MVSTHLADAAELLTCVFSGERVALEVIAHKNTRGSAEWTKQ